MTTPAFDTALDAARTYRATALEALRTRLESSDIDTEQRAAHGFAWVATSVAALEAISAWIARNGNANPLDVQVARLAFAETIAQLIGGLPMGQNEFFRPMDLGLGEAVRTLAAGCSGVLYSDHAATRAAVAEALAQGQWPSETFHDSDLDTIRDQFRRFTEAEILPNAHRWHLANDLIPDATVQAMAELGTFGVCIPEEFGGLGLGKQGHEMRIVGLQHSSKQGQAGEISGGALGGKQAHLRLMSLGTAWKQRIFS